MTVPKIGAQSNKSIHIVLPPQQMESRNLPSLNEKKLTKAVEKGKVLMGRCWNLLMKRKTEPSRGFRSKKFPIKEREGRKHANNLLLFRIHPRYLELEPLCCVSSCLIRTGCFAVVVFELAFVTITAFVLGFKIYDGGRTDAWDELCLNSNVVITHQFSLYLLGLFDLLTLLMSFCLLFGIFTFERVFVKVHWHFDFFALLFNGIAFFLFVFALNSEGPETWTWENVLLLVTFACQIPLQIWAISVVKACYDFYVLLYVFVTLSEK